MNEAFQRLAAAVALLLALPLLVVVSILVLASLGRPVFFVQERAGYKGRPFRIFKFRTLGPGAAPPEARLTRLGRFLRATSLDELPELWNVVRGEMNLVGPRPLLTGYLPLYSKRQARRHEVKPGLSGWAQVNGRNATTWEERLSLDVFYVENRSLRLDLLILWKTPRTVLRREGIYAPGGAMMSEFAGPSALENRG